jgi:hypothetical protein
VTTLVAAWHLLYQVHQIPGRTCRASPMAQALAGCALSVAHPPSGKGGPVNEDESLRRYGLRPSAADLEQVRELLEAHAALERQRQGDGDTELMKLCCVQLFTAGDVGDVLTIWQAKTSSWDAHCSIDVQLLCGAGLEETKAYLGAEGSEDGSAALDCLLACEAAGDFVDFSVKGQSGSYARYYLG